MTNLNTPVVVNLLANDSDPDGDRLSVASYTQASHGVASLNADGTITYTPNAGYTGSDTFTYTITDGTGGTSTGTITITGVPSTCWFRVSAEILHLRNFDIWFDSIRTPPPPPFGALCRALFAGGWELLPGMHYHGRAPQEEWGGIPPPGTPVPDCGVHYLWFAFVCFSIRSHSPPGPPFPPPPYSSSNV